MADNKIDSLRKLMGPLAGDEEMNISLFIVSKKSPRLKKLDLNSQLSPKERSEKLHKWAQGHRLVAVIEMGDQVFAHANAKFAAQLENQEDLTINGKKVSSVNALSDAEYEQLSIIDAAFEEFVQNSKSDESEKSLENTSSTRKAIRQFFAARNLVSDETYMAHFLAMISNLPDKIILKCLKMMSESRREVEERRKEDQKKKDILQDAINKEILQQEVVKREIAGQQLKVENIAADAARVNKTRSS